MESNDEIKQNHSNGIFSNTFYIDKTHLVLHFVSLCIFDNKCNISIYLLSKNYVRAFIYTSEFILDENETRKYSSHVRIYNQFKTKCFILYQIYYDRSRIHNNVTIIVVNMCAKHGRSLTLDV